MHAGFLASAGRDAVIHVYECQGFTLVNTLEEHSAAVTAVAFRCVPLGDWIRGARPGVSPSHEVLQFAAPSNLWSHFVPPPSYSLQWRLPAKLQR